MGFSGMAGTRSAFADPDRRRVPAALRVLRERGSQSSRRGSSKLLDVAIGATAGMTAADELPERFVDLNSHGDALIVYVFAVANALGRDR